MLDEKECDHASHFFGDTAFEEKVEFPFVGCEENPTQPTTKLATIWERYSDPGSEWSKPAVFSDGSYRYTVRTLIGASYHLDLYYKGSPSKRVGIVTQSGSDPLYINMMGIFGKNDSNEPVTQDGYVFFIIGVKALRIGTNEPPVYHYYSVRTHTKQADGSVFVYDRRNETDSFEVCRIANEVFSDPILRYKATGSCKQDTDSTDVPTPKSPEPEIPKQPTKDRRLYNIHRYDPEIGWYVFKQSNDIEDFDEDDQWAFNHILTTGVEYVKQGNTMYTIRLMGQDVPDQPKRGRGRPPGAKNKPKDDSPKAPKRGRGRPPGSKNKPKDSERAPRDYENESELPPIPPEPEEKNEERPQSKSYDENPETAKQTDFLMKVGSDIFQKLEVGDDDATQKVYDWFASAPDDVSGLITDEQMMTLLDLLLKD
jgi:hypothetical protein